MKTKLFLTLGLIIALAFTGENSFSQISTPTPSPSLVHSKAKNADILIVTGRILDAETKEPVKNAKINFDRFGDEMLQASLDEKGNYALALNKKELGQPLRIAFKIAGYKRYVIKCGNKNSNYLDADIFLEPMQSAEKSSANVKYTMRDDAFDTMVIKMQ